MDFQSSWLGRAAVCGFAAGAFFVAAFSSAQESQSRPSEPEFTGTTLPLDPVANASEVGDKAKKDEPAAAAVAPAEPKSAWYDHPAGRPTPRPGYFAIAPKGPGYYSLMDVVMGDYRLTPPKSGYPPFGLMATPFFETDFRYVDDPKQSPDFLEKLHRIHLGDNWLFGTGGQAWWRHMREISSRFTGRINDYDLWRVRTYGDLWYRDSFRIYAEFISANTVSQDLAPLRIDEDRADLQNLFIDVKIGEIDCRPVYLRVGRQEMLLGSQRAISPPDWANTRRTFQGVRSTHQGEKFDFDLFWVQPIVPDTTHFNSVDHNQNFYGAWFTYRPQKGTFVDLYYLFLDNANNTTALGLTTAPTSVHTLGARYTGDHCQFLWDFEGMLQLGQRDGQSIRAGNVSAGLGYNFANVPMNPTVWGYYDWATGDPSPNSADYNTYNQLFPFGHYYFGWLDLVGRQNIRDLNAHLYLYPAKWLSFNVQYHIFNLDRASDALYNVAGAPSRVSLKGAAGGRVGQELDLILNIHVGKHSDVLLGYSRLNPGDFISNTGSGRTPELYYLMYNFRW